MGYGLSSVLVSGAVVLVDPPEVAPEVFSGILPTSVRQRQAHGLLLQAA